MISQFLSLGAGFGLAAAAFCGLRLDAEPMWNAPNSWSLLPW